MNLKNTFGGAAAAGSGLSKTPRDQYNNNEESSNR